MSSILTPVFSYFHPWTLPLCKPWNEFTVIVALPDTCCAYILSLFAKLHLSIYIFQHFKVLKCPNALLLEYLRDCRNFKRIKSLIVVFKSHIHRFTVLGRYFNKIMLMRWIGSDTEYSLQSRAYWRLEESSWLEPIEHLFCFLWSWWKVSKLF